MSQDVCLAVPRLLSHRAIPDDVVLAMGYWAVLEVVDRDGKLDGFSVSRPSSRACKGSRTGKRQRIVAQNTSRSKYVPCTGGVTSLLARLGIRRLTVEHRETCAGSSRALVHGESHDAVPWPMPGGADRLAAASARVASEPSGLAKRKRPTFARRLDCYRRASDSYGRAVDRRPKGAVQCGRAVRNPTQRDAGEDVYDGRFT